MALRVDFSSKYPSCAISKRGSSVQEVCHSFASNFWWIKPCPPPNLGWAGTDVNANDPVEIKLAGRLQMSALAYVAGYNFGVCVDP